MSASASRPFPFRLEFPPELPISARAEEVVAAIQAHPVVILAGETGSGKTTQIPKMCLAAGRGVQGRIACTQPRRVAALSVSRRVAEELNVAWGREVGCKIRFNDHTSAATVIKFLTDGMLLAEVQGDPLLRAYDTIIIDEAHERSLNIDFLLGHLRLLRHRRPELKIIITSATIDTAMFSQAFDDAPVVQVSGRTHPVEVIYAPLDELGRDYAANDENEDRSDPGAVASAKAEALHYIDGAVEAVRRIFQESTSGDVLVFMPSERDIRETCDLLEGRLLKQCELVPLFGRLTNAEQQRVFSPSARRKLIVATNIAETSLTIPGIRFVVDTGLARISRYSPQTRTRRLPIEPVAQSSADQRKGRAGRVAAGVCIRLYSEKDFLERPRFAQPEIQRANLADVILRLKAFGLGDIERFPFINMPATKAVRAGYALLEELGAIGEDAGAATRELTEIGRELARLPVDPAVGRMILQARREQALREVLVIAAGLSIQDPRERPLDRQAQADAAHRRFLHPDSDFLTLLNIWEAYHDEFETMTQARLRRFCREHFLSYSRMREWRDIHAQLVEVVQERKEVKVTSAYHGLKEIDAQTTGFGSPAYRAIHRSILTGLLGNIAVRDEESGLYKAAHDRKAALFPGSVLFRREESRKKSGAKPADARVAPKGAKAPRWIMAAEIMETTRLFARTCARLDPPWAVDLGSHLLRVAHSEPFWSAEKGRVMVKQRSRLYGLEVESRAVGYGRIDPRAATEIFIREGLVNDTITWPFGFLAANRAVRQEVENALTRTRDAGYLNLDEAIYRFYAARIENISAVAELVDLVRERQAAEPHWLEMQAGDLRDPAALAPDPAAFPAELPLENRALPLAYAYKPGQADDGVTLDVSVREAEALTAAELDWAVPGHLAAKVEHYLRALPKELRRAFVPLAETAKSLAAQVGARDRLTGRRETLTEALAAQVQERFGVRVLPEIWAGKPLPENLRVRVRVLDGDGTELCASRELAEVRAALGERLQAASTTVAQADPAAWQQARRQWEKPGQAEWTFGDIPVQVLVTEQAGVPVHAYPGLKPGPGAVALRLYNSADEAAATNRRGVAALLELQLRHDLGWLQRDLKALRELGPLTATLGPVSQLQEQAFESIRRWVCDPARVIGAGGTELRAAAFAAALEQAKGELRGLVPRLGDRLREILTLRQELLVHAQPYPGLGEEVTALLPADFLQRVPYERLAHLPRYLRAMALRCERAQKNPAKDRERAQQLAPYVKAVAKLAGAGRVPTSAQAPSRGEGTPPPATDVESFRWLVEEFRVSLFAQELGTAEPVSAVKLDRAQAALPSGIGPPVEPAVRAPLPSIRPVTAAAKVPVKSLSALDRLFRPKT
ncbi:MAG: ATP-dependent RNA helicase HrpA [Opitutales bacterium]